MPKINAQRLLGDLDKLRSFGEFGNGVVRPSFSEVDMKSREWLVTKLTEANLEASIDGIGNVFGISKNPGPAILIGSHTDTQPTGGWLDGAMGVIYGLEISRAMQESSDTSRLAIDVASWIDEEATYVGFLGSRSFVNDLPQKIVDESVNERGYRLVDALRDYGLHDRERIHYREGRYLGYLEAHIEQGPYLEAENKQIGVVTSIIGMRDFDVNFIGQQNHAGTTPMHLRKDAGAAAIEFAHRVRHAFQRLAHERTVYTVGRIRFHPGAPSIVPGSADLILQFRDADDDLLDRMEECAENVLNEVAKDLGVTAEIKHRSNDAVSAQMDMEFQKHLSDSAERYANGKWMAMPSGAAHDAQVISKVMPAGMLFVPSINGISHDFCEDTSREDIVLGCQVLASACASLLQA